MKISIVLATCLLLPWSLVVSKPVQAEQTQIIRATSQTYEVRGWEKGLCHGDPSLGHWHWIPLQKRVMTMEVSNQRQLKAASSRSYNESKPKHVSVGLMRSASCSLAADRCHGNLVRPVTQIAEYGSNDKFAGNSRSLSYTTGTSAKLYR